MTYDIFVSALLKTVNAREEQEKYLDGIPSDIQTAFFDNAYVAESELLVEHLLKLLVGEDLMSEIYWFMYDMPVTGGDITTKDGKDYHVTSDVEFLDYIKQEYFK